MNRRTVLAGAGAALGPSFAGCLGDAGTADSGPSEDERRAAACSHAPDDADGLAYETAIRQVGHEPLVVGERGGDDSADPRPPLALVATAADVEARLRLDAIDDSDEASSDVRASDEATADIHGFVEDTDFESEALLAWQPTLSGSFRIDVVGVVRPEVHALHAYTCEYHLGGGNGTADDPYAVLVRVSVPERPRRATVTHRSGTASGERHDETTYEDSRAVE